MRNTILGLGLLASLFLGGVAFGAHFLGADSVDAGEIRYGDSTIYDDARIWATNQWNAQGRVSILPDNIWTYEDVRWYDAWECSVSWDGMWIGGWGTHTIKLNACKLRNYSNFKKRAVATHELGHALGLADHRLSDFSSKRVSMYFCSTCSGINTPQAHDISDYNSLW